uniref:calcium-binding allergen Ole e 8-like n=1 Tax=Erigeron canadensis TaxID=72917 RepID=UPI001CB99989|nr:calcium-binding allergen Ole e 8-like [Erigeron canadensis]
MAAEITKPSLHLTKANEIKHVFSRFDMNKDGKISAVELVDIMKALGSDTSVEEVNVIMTHIDTDQDGFINLEEFTRFCKATADVDDENDGEGVNKELKNAFEMYDLNKNGLISATELHHILGQLGEGCSVDDCVKMIEPVDSDGDGFVNFEEFKKMMSNTPPSK